MLSRILTKNFNLFRGTKGSNMRPCVSGLMTGSDLPSWHRAAREGHVCVLSSRLAPVSVDALVLVFACGFMNMNLEVKTR